MSLSQDKSCYIETIQTKSYDGDLNSNLKLSAMLRHMQQIGIDHIHALEAEGLVPRLQGSAFVLSKLDLRLTRLPRAGERLTVLTAPQPNVKAQFMRYYAISDSAGQPVAESMTSWMLFDFAARRVLRPTAYPFGFEMREQGSITGAEMDKLRLRMPETVIEAPSRVIRYSDIDLNHHLNNTVYADIVCDALPFELMSTLLPEQLQLQFMREAKVSDVLDLCFGQEDGAYYVGGTKQDDQACFAAKLRFKKM